MAETRADWVGILQVMEQCSRKLPAQWEADFWLGSLQTLAEVVAETRRVLTEEQQGVLVGVGAMMCRQIEKEAEALSMTEQVFGRIRDGGARG